MIRCFSLFLCLLIANTAWAGYEAKLSTAELLSQTDLVVVGRLTSVVEWSADNVDYGKGTIEVTETLFGKATKTKKITLRWSNRQYTSGRLDFEATGQVEFIWLLWRARDGTFRVRHSDQKERIVAAIEKRAEQESADQPATAVESKVEGEEKPKTE